MHTCGVCGQRATCAYSYGAGELFACPAHDPTRQPFWGTTVIGPSFTYRTLPPFPAPVLCAQHTFTATCDGWHPPGPCPPSQPPVVTYWDAGSWG